MHTNMSIEKINPNVGPKKQHNPTSSAIKSITVAVLLALSGQSVNAQNLDQMSPDIRNEWKKTIDNKNDKEIDFKCETVTKKTNDTYKNNISPRGWTMYNDCDTIRTHDLYIDVAPRTDNFKYDTKIDSIYKEEWRTRKNTGITMMPFTDEIWQRLINNNDISKIGQDIHTYLLNWNKWSLPQAVVDSIDMIYDKNSPDILNVTVPRGLWWVWWVTYMPSYKDHEFSYRSRNMTVVKNIWDFENKPVSWELYSKVKAHEEWHILWKAHPDQDHPYNEDGIEVPWWDKKNRSGYMASNASWWTTREDTDINIDMAIWAKKVLLKINEARDCALSINDPNITEADIVLYPNPTSAYINIRDENNQIEREKATISNIIWAKLAINKQNNNTIDLSSLPSGTYFLQLPLKTGKIRIANIIKI